MDNLTKKQRQYNMSHIRSADTKPEVMLRKALWKRGWRYRKNYAALPGKPDIVLTRQKIAVFVDGDFWHAHGHQDNPGEQVASNQVYWQKKLARNVERDREVNDELTEAGWLVLRFWESEIKKDLQACITNFTSGRFFCSEYYFSLCWLPPSDNEGRLKSMLIEDHDEHTVTVEENLQDFMEMADSLCRIFGELEIPAELLDEAGLASYLHSCVSDNRRRIRPPKDEFCDGYLYDADLIGGNSPKLGENYLKIVVPKAYPKSSVFGMLNNLNRLNFPYRWVTRYYLLDKTEAISKLDTRKTRWKGKMEYFSSTVKRLILNSAPQPSDINENAVEKVEEVQEAPRSVDAGDVGYGYYSTEVIIAERNYERACLYAKAVEDVFKSQMMKPKIEDVGHTIIVGPTGAGKSVHLNMISAQFRKYRAHRCLSLIKAVPAGFSRRLWDVDILSWPIAKMACHSSHWLLSMMMMSACGLWDG